MATPVTRVFHVALIFSDKLHRAISKSQRAIFPSRVRGRGYKIGPVCVSVCVSVCLSVIQLSNG